MSAVFGLGNAGLLRVGGLDPISAGANRAAGAPVLGWSDRLPAALALPFRIPLRALSSLADIAGTIDRRTAQLLQAIVALQAPLERIDGKVGVLDRSVNDRLDAVRADFGAGIGDVDQRLLAMVPVLEGMAAHVEESARLLPDPSDGPLARLRHTLTPS